MALRINHKDNSIQFNEVAAPETPPAGTAVVYVDSTTGALTVKNDAGTPITGLIEIVEDTTPQLGGNLSVNNKIITTEPVDTPTSDGNQINILSGDGGATSGSGGTINITSGAGPEHAGGAINITTGTSGNSASGSITLKTGVASDNGGKIILELGAGTAPGDVYIQSGTPASTHVPELRFVEATTNGTRYVALQAPLDVVDSVVWTLPQETHANANGKFITSNASGILSFVQGITNPMAADLDVSTFLVKASASTYLDLDDTTTTLHAGGGLTLGSVNLITIEPDSKAGSGATTSIAAGRSTAGIGGNLNLNGGQGVTTGGDIILTPGTGSPNGIVQVTGSAEIFQSNGTLALDVNATEVLGGTLNDVVILDRVQGKASNLFKSTNWIRRNAAGNDWQTTVWHNAISVDTSFATPGTDTQCWEERDPKAASISFGSGATTYLTLATAGASFSGTQILADIGTISLPGITFSGDNNTGIYQPSTNANEMRFACGGSNNFAIESNGTLNVLGTSNYEDLVTHDDDIPNKAYVDTKQTALNTVNKIELSSTNTGDRNALIDFHSSDDAGQTDYSARLMRALGVNGDFKLESRGTGNVSLTAGVGGTSGAFTLSTSGNVSVTGATPSVDAHLTRKDYVDDGDRLTINAKTANYTLLITDENNLITMSSTGALTLTVPTNASVAFPIGTQILVERENTGTVTVAGAGVTFHSAGSLLSLASQYSTLTLIKKATDTWLVAGDLA